MKDLVFIIPFRANAFTKVYIFHYKVIVRFQYNCKPS